MRTNRPGTRVLCGPVRLLSIGLLLLVPGPGSAGDERFFDSNGVKLAYRDEGEPTGTPVVLLHGFLADNRTQWDSAADGPKVVTALAKAKKYRLILLDTRGHGKSEKPVDEKKYGTELAEDVGRLMAHLKVQKAHVVGYSMGAWVAQRFALDHPDQVLSLTVGGVGAFGAGEKKSLEAIVPMLQGYADGGADRARALEKLLPGLALPAKKDVPALVAARRGTAGLLLTDAQATAYPGPVLVLVGADDPRKGRAEELKGARARAGKKTAFETVPGDHFTAPAANAFAAKLVAFLGAH